MKTSVALLCICPVLLAGCANRPDPPLLFGASHIYGVSIGASGAEAGAEFVVGYKGANLAVIPVSAIERGTERGVGAWINGASPESYSVFGQFGGDATKSSSVTSAGLGKFFATGAAAQKLANGYALKMGLERSTTNACIQQAKDKGKDENRKTAATRADPGLEDRVARRMRSMAAAAEATPSSPAPGAKLLFAQYDYFALAIDASAVDTGAKLTLGFKDRNVAIVPVIGRDADGNVVPLGSSLDGFDDSFSVLGQFESKNDDQNSKASSVLNSFFSTGAAANALSDGFRVKLCEEFKAAAKN